MPKYTFFCIVCGSSQQKFANVNSIMSTCECGAEMTRRMPKLGGLKTTEVVDKYTNKKHVADQKEILTERKLDYYWGQMVPEFVRSGTYSIETMVEKGWVTMNEKGEMIINNKPPQKR